MICASIQNCNAAEIMEILSRVEMAEIRMDLCDLSDDDIREVFSSDVPLIATCRIAGTDIKTCEHRLVEAIKAGARYADLEIEAPKPVSKRVAQACAEWGTVMIRSYHDFQGTASLDELREMVDKCRHHDGEIVKIVTTATCPEDALRVEELYKYYTADFLVAFAMGELGSATRLECLRLGAPFSYACLGSENATASGQIDYSDMYARVYAGFDMVDAPELRMPASKSYAQRAVIASALADGTSTLRGYSPCDDSENSLAVAKALGAKVSGTVEPDGSTTLSVEGIGATVGCLQQGTLDVGESGLLTRLMIPVASQLYSAGARIEGHGTLLRRPLQGAAVAMKALGAKLSCNRTSSADGSALCNPQDLLIPVDVQGPLNAGKAVIDGSKSSQLVSGALMALPLLAKHSSISVQNPTSIPYIYMTMDILRKFGIKVRSEMYGGRALLDEDWSKCTEILLKVKENQQYKPADMDIEGDWSAATVFLATGAVFGKVALTGLDTTSLQADLTMMDILMEAGASLSQMDEPKGVISASRAPLRAIKADLTNSPDLFPVVAVFCAFCQGQSQLKGVHRLLHKESNRADAILQMLAQAGVRAQVKGDDLLVWGESLESRIMNSHKLHGGSYTSHHDHRMVMALRLAGLGADAPIEIDDTACVAKSYPQFNTVWDEYIRKKL